MCNFYKFYYYIFIILQFSSLFLSYKFYTFNHNKIFYNNNNYIIKKNFNNNIDLYYNKLLNTKLFAKRESKDFLCTECGTNYLQWEGKCKICNSWNTIKEFRKAPITNSISSSLSSTLKKNKNWYGDTNNELILLSSITGRKAPKRVLTFSEEMNRVLGGGLVLGSVSLLAGEPGIGKSTLLLQLASFLSKHSNKTEEIKPKVVYLSGEESPEQLAMRSDRLGNSNSNLYVTSETRLSYLLPNLNNLLENIEAETKKEEENEGDTSKPKELHPILLIVDSIQTLSPTNENSIGSGLLTAGTPSAIRESAAQLIQWAKETGSIVILAGHLTKTGEVAGPHLLEHMVDVIMMLQSGGELNDIKVRKKSENNKNNLNSIENSEVSDYKSGSLRILSSTKNRFGSTSEVGMFLMSNDGIEDIDEIGGNLLHNYNEKDLDNFNSNFTTYYQAPEGCSIISTFHGNRPLLTEVQCLVTPMNQGPEGFSFKTPKRWSIGGYPLSRLILLISVVEKRMHLQMNHHEVIINIASSSNKNINTNTLSNSNIINGFHSKRNLYDDSLSDLPILLSLLSSRLNLKIKPGLISFGEIGLGGELRGTNENKDFEKSLKDIHKWGIHKVILPKSWQKNRTFTKDLKGKKFFTEKLNNIEFIYCSNLKEAAEYAFDLNNFGEYLKEMKTKSRKNNQKKQEIQIFQDPNNISSYEGEFENI